MCVCVYSRMGTRNALQDDEMGSAVNLQTRQVRKIMNELHQDHLVCEYEPHVLSYLLCV